MRTLHSANNNIGIREIALTFILDLVPIKQSEFLLLLNKNGEKKIKKKNYKVTM